MLGRIGKAEIHACPVYVQLLEVVFLLLVQMAVAVGEFLLRKVICLHPQRLENLILHLNHIVRHEKTADLLQEFNLRRHVAFRFQQVQQCIQIVCMFHDVPP